MLPDPNKKVNPQEEIPNTHPRLPKPDKVVLLDEDDVNYVDRAVKRFGDELAKCREKQGWTNRQLLERLNPDYFPSTETISRLVNHDQKRLPSWGQVVDAHRVLGLDLNALADGDKPLTLEQLSDAELAIQFEQYAAEMSRRMRQKGLPSRA